MDIKLWGSSKKTASSLGNPNLEYIVKNLQFAMSSRCLNYQTASIAQNLPISLYHELYNTLEENTLGKRLKKARMKLGLSQKQLSVKCNINRSTIMDYENYSINPSKEALMRLSKVIDLNYICISRYSKFILSDYSSIIKNKLTIRKVAKILNVDSTILNRWEKGTYMVSKYNYERIKDIIHKYNNILNSYILDP
ncbi:helix-turn-helix domain-containing protein [Clostridium sporogenes]|uniref:helix-turn-helix domain-containing protein n=1 Tax=Clostridium sporogenes TaxID=1509 RepID=UPI00223735EB|nr:helix-turn-helix transcriptional regulator [Clostridium sporogenes]MCW6110083.1 helix-turn-helix domain-containing protein [Clostridium sporogenes]